MNRNGGRTVDARVRLEDELREVRAEGPLVEYGADPEEWQIAVNGLTRLVELGEEFELFWASCVHGEDLPPPGEAAKIKGNWGAWLKEAKKYANDLAESRRAAGRMRTAIGGVTDSQPDPPQGPGPEEVEIAEEVAACALDLAATEPPDFILKLLATGYPVIFQRSPEATDVDVWKAMNAMARMGYFTRVAETIVLEERALQGTDEVMDLLLPQLEGDTGAEPTDERLAEVAHYYARSEVHYEPPPGSLLVTVSGQSAAGRMECAYKSISPFALPIDGGAFLEQEAYADGREPNVLDGDEVLRCWLFGFFFRVFLECFLLEENEAEHGAV